MVFARRDRQLLAVRLDRDAEWTGLEVAPGLPGTAHARATMAAGSIHVPVAALAKLEAAQADHRRDDGRHSQAGAHLATHGVAVQLAMREADSHAAHRARLPTEAGCSGEADAGGCMTAGDVRLTCRHCRAVLFAPGTRLGDEALRMLREHLRQVHPRVPLPPAADAGAILAHFDVQRVAP